MGRVEDPIKDRLWATAGRSMGVSPGDLFLVHKAAWYPIRGGASLGLMLKTYWNLISSFVYVGGHDDV